MFVHGARVETAENDERCTNRYSYRDAKRKNFPGSRTLGVLILSRLPWRVKSTRTGEDGRATGRAPSVIRQRTSSRKLDAVQRRRIVFLSSAEGRSPDEPERLETARGAGRLCQEEDDGRWPRTTRGRTCLHVIQVDEEMCRQRGSVTSGPRRYRTNPSVLPAPRLTKNVSLFSSSRHVCSRTST